MTPVISIIVPAYNRENIIKETIYSIKSQSYTDWELIIVDDGSNDNSYNVVLNESKNDDRIKCLKREKFTQKKGAPACRNIGIKQSIGKYIIFLDSDDLLINNSLEDRINTFEKHKELDAIIFNGAFFETKIGDQKILWNKYTDENDLDRFLRGDVVWQTTGPIWRSSFLKENNIFFDEDALSGQDWEFHIKTLLKKPRYIKVNSAPDYYIRRNSNENRISSNHYCLNKYMNRVDICNKIVKHLTNKQQNLLFTYCLRDVVATIPNAKKIDVILKFKNFVSLTVFEKTFLQLPLLTFFIANKSGNHFLIKNSKRIINLLFRKHYKFFKTNYRSTYDKAY